MPRYQFSIQYDDRLPSPLKTVELADESRAWAAGKQVVDHVVARLDGNKQLAMATLIVTDVRGSLVCALPFSADFGPALGSFRAPH